MHRDSSVLFVCLGCGLLVSAACGGAPKPAAVDPSDTASLDQGSPTSTAPSAMPPPAADAPAPTASRGSAADTPPSAAAPVWHPAPAATGSIDGKPFTPKVAKLAGPLQKDGRVSVILRESGDCAAPADAEPGDASMLLVVPWKNGYKTDLSSLKRAKKTDLGEAAFVRVGMDRKKQVSTTFRPSGLVTVVTAPTQQGAFGRMKIDLQSGDYMLVGDLDVNVCDTAK
jgi:hypothetical protein